MTESLFRDLDENYKRINEKIAVAALKVGKKPEDITLLAATKTVGIEKINHAISLGLKAVGENRVQELIDKYSSLNLENCQCHFIGRLQTNKIKYLAERVCQIQSIDSISQVKELSKQMKKANKSMNILVEVNIGLEENKGGVLPEALYEFIDEASKYEGVRVNGLMTIPPFTENMQILCKYFTDIQKYYVDIGAKKLDNVNMSILSMGMSGDFTHAIECGSNMVRVGSALFGSRIYD